MMLRIICGLLFCLMAWIAIGQPVITPPIFIPSSGGGGPTIFTLPTGDVLHYIAPSASGGSDSNDGLAPAVGGGHGPWASPNHTLNCGDVIIAIAGTYSTSWGTNSWGNPTNCPSTTGGIDGTGGIYFTIILCAGPNLESCQFNSGGSVAMQIGWGNGQTSGGSNGRWAVEGFKITTGNSSHAVESIGCGPGTQATFAKILDHLAFINNVVYNSGIGIDLADCGSAHNVPGNGTDYWAVVGNITESAVNDPLCIGSIDAGSPANSSGTVVGAVRVFIHGNFSYNNTFDCPNHTDSENYLFDTYNAHAFNGETILSNNFGWHACRNNWAQETGSDNLSPPLATFQIHHNTFYGGWVCIDPPPTAGTGEVHINTGQPYPMNIFNNIAQTNVATAGGLPFNAGPPPTGGGVVYAMLFGGSAGCCVTVNGSTGNENIYKGLATSCVSTCDAGDNVTSYAGSFGVGTNFYVNPAFANTTDLLANWLQTPNCTGFASVTQCMGYNPLTPGTNPRANTPIADLTPSCAQCTNKGYQLPSSTCITSSSPFFSDYPSWLKGIVRLQWNSGTQTITQMRDLVSVPCGL